MLEGNDCSPGDIKKGPTLLLGLPNFKPAQARLGRTALVRYSQGMDFADALHLGSSSNKEALMTFDKAFVRKAGNFRETHEGAYGLKLSRLRLEARPSASPVSFNTCKPKVSPRKTKK